MSDEIRDPFRMIQELRAQIELRHAVIGKQRCEIERLKAGRFTPEEFQNLCHSTPETDKRAFFQGCHEYQKKLFGASERELLGSEIAGRCSEIARLHREIKAAKEHLLKHIPRAGSRVDLALDRLYRALDPSFPAPEENNPRQTQALASESQNEPESESIPGEHDVVLDAINEAALHGET